LAAAKSLFHSIILSWSGMLADKEWSESFQRANGTGDHGTVENEISRLNPPLLFDYRLKIHR
jgi:hypothetical protein